MSATHTHSAWGPGNNPFAGRGRPRAPGGFPAADPNAPPPPIVAQIVDAVRQAKAKLQSASVGFGTGMSYLNVSRDNIDAETHRWTQAPNLKGASDKTVAVLKFSAPDGELIAVLLHLRHASGERLPGRVHQRGLSRSGLALYRAGLRRQGGRGVRAECVWRSEPAVSSCRH